jgi:hypothetical protein
LLFNIFGKVSRSVPNKPPILYLQLDNCTKDNKNQFVIYFVFNHLFQQLVWVFECAPDKKVVPEIVLVYLPVGHEKVDRMLFTKIGKLKKTQKCETPAKFKSFVAKAFKCTPWNPEVDKNMLVWDWKTWLAPHLRSLKIQRFPCLLLHFKSRSDGQQHMGGIHPNVVGQTKSHQSQGQLVDLQQSANGT